MGFVSLTWTMKRRVLAVALSLATGTKPELMPLGRGTQGLEKFDCVTLWFFGL